MSIVVTSAPNPWPHEDVKGTWKIEEEPNGKQRIWISNKGKSCGIHLKKMTASLLKKGRVEVNTLIP
eukprot:12926897-Prorocentrum_lima.AAC.1